MDSQVNTILTIALTGAVSFLVGSGIERFRNHNKNRQMLNVIYGELLNIERHYAYVSNVNFENSSQPSEKMKMTMAKFGACEVIENKLEEISFLSPSQIASLLQLALFIRNNDTVIDMTIGQCGNGDNVDLEKINRRSKTTSTWTSKIMKSIEDKQKYLKSANSFIG